MPLVADLGYACSHDKDTFGPPFQTARRPITKCKIKEITANTSSKWINPPATWNTVNPQIQAISKITNNIVHILICSFSSVAIQDPTGSRNQCSDTQRNRRPVTCQYGTFGSRSAIWLYADEFVYHSFFSGQLRPSPGN